MAVEMGWVATMPISKASLGYALYSCGRIREKTEVLNWMGKSFGAVVELRTMLRSPPVYTAQLRLLRV